MAFGRRALSALTACAMALSACGGGGGGGSGASPTPGNSGGAPSGGTPPPVASNGCSLRERQDWAAAQLREWYLFPETLPATLDPAPYATLDDYVDALTATARAQRRDRYFTYVTSIAEDNAFYNSGTTASFGFRLALDQANRTLMVTEAFEGGPALAAGIDRGTSILAIGTNGGNLRNVTDILATEGGQGVGNALGESDPSVTRTFRISNASGVRTVTLTSADFALTPVSSRYGARILNEGGRQIGYINLRTFIRTADPALREAFASFRAAGVTDVVVDLRYNGGGLLSVAELLANLLGGNRAPTDVIDHLTFRPEKSVENETTFFAPQPQSIAATRIAFIGTGATASASELVVNTFVPYLRGNVALVGTNTYGKPVGQIGLDRSACDDRLRVVAFAVQNAARSAAYFDGLAGTVEASCRASDDVSRPLGDPQEASLRAAIDFLLGRSCPRITADAQRTLSADQAGRREALTTTHADTAQREVPGLF